MATGRIERKAIRTSHVGAPPQEPEHLPCPRCESTNTKFCYYNNYNFSQPRHFCKSCRRYWTRGGTLRDVPVGGGGRKSAKRTRTTISTNGAFSSAHHDFIGFPVDSNVLVPFGADHGGAGPFVGGAKGCGSFTSLLNTNTQGTGIWAMGGFGLGLGTGLDDVGFGLGSGVWPFSGVVEGGPAGVNGNTWRFENGESGFVGDGDCFTLPDLAISTPELSFMK